MERALGARADGERRATSTCAGENLLMSVNQNVPTCVAAGTNNGCRPDSDVQEQQPVLVGWPIRTITGCTSRSCSGRRDWASVRVSYTLSKSMNNVGEAFFSSPIDPTDIIDATGAAPTTTSATGSWSTGRSTRRWRRRRRRGSTSATASR